MKFTTNYAVQKRAEVQAKAESIGVDEIFIEHLVTEFYARIQQHPILGPLFNGPLENRWTTHLLTMKNFWKSVALNAGLYSGKPVLVHQQLKNLRADHFQIWLHLFKETLEDLATNQEAVDYLFEKTERIAASLSRAMFVNENKKTNRS